MNADEADKCYDLAQQAVKDRDFDKAERMLNKSIKLQETDKAKVLLGRLEYLRNQLATPPPNVDHEKQAPGTPDTDSPLDQRPYTEAQEKICDEINAEKDYYKILGVEKDVSEIDMKKAFKRRAIRVHPDKNSCPKANDAFQKVNQAMSTLQDAEKRRIYD